MAFLKVLRASLVWLLLIVIIGGAIAAWLANFQFARLGYLDFSQLGSIFFSQPSSTPAERGTFGDSFGAVNALFSGLAFIGLAIAIILQRQELAIVKAERADTQRILEQQTQELQETKKARRLTTTLSQINSFRSDFYIPSVSGNDEPRGFVAIEKAVFALIRKDQTENVAYLKPLCQIIITYLKDISSEASIELDEYSKLKQAEDLRSSLFDWEITLLVYYVAHHGSANECVMIEELNFVDSDCYPDIIPFLEKLKSNPSFS
ncbi:hypothetical protein [Polycladidibacter hongkongensis]|uniref:hypothetical protein n=1 Tax=Polycladidibacter hongkongensis TaxID=1647556 RepID=UPI000835468E|nr:hypothetical protein [Pseudovibrio hongkongensis]